MNPAAQALQLIRQLYRAAAAEVTWQDFVNDLSDAYSGALVCLCLEASSEVVSEVASDKIYTAGLVEEFGSSLWRHWAESMPWRVSARNEASPGFVSAGAAFPDSPIEKSDFYRKWMAPRGLPPVWPLWFSVVPNPLLPKVVITILRQPGAGAPFSPRELELGRELTLHLQHGFDVHFQMAGAEWNRKALKEAVNRLRFGIVLLDSERRLLSSNRSADRIFASGSGVELRDSQLHGIRPDDDRALQLAIDRAMKNVTEHRFHLEESISFARELERPSMDVVVKPLPSSAPGSAANDAIIAVGLVNLDEASTFPAQKVRRLYSLTDAEADLLRFLIEGASLQEAAERRGVAVNTARSQLKAVFQKTGTKKQSELIQLVVAGIMALNVEDVADEFATRGSSEGDE